MHGRYTVNLTVTDAGTGRSSMNRTTYINVTPNPAWYSCNWQHRKVITINHNMVYGTQSFFPVLINLTSDNDLRTGARSNGYDILFTSSDGVSKLPHEIEKYTSGSGALTAWVKVPAVTDASDTTLYLYYGNPAAGNQQDRVNVWTASFQSVWHLNETTGGTNAIKDATSTSNDGTGRNSPTLGAAGKFGNAVTFDGTNDYISTETQYTNPQTFTISLWFKTTNAVSRKIFGFESSQTGTGSASWDRQIYIGTGGYLLDGVYDGNTKIVISDSTMNDGNWHNAVMTHASNTLKLYVDGSFIGQNATSGAETTTGYWRMGSYKLANWPYSSGDGYFQGTLDEVRIAPVERSPEWIATEYLNQNSPPTFYSVGNEEQWTC
jgi:MSHA biogenesis protein MshQ